MHGLLVCVRGRRSSGGGGSRPGGGGSAVCSIRTVVTITLEAQWLPPNSGRTTSLGAELLRRSDGCVLDCPLRSNWGGFATRVACMEGLCVMARPKNTENFGQNPVCTHTAVISEGVGRFTACWYVCGGGTAVVGAAVDLRVMYGPCVRFMPCGREADVAGCDEL